MLIGFVLSNAVFVQLPEIEEGGFRRILFPGIQ